MQLSDGGKGSVLRKPSVSHDTFASNWDRIFAAKHQPECDWKLDFGTHSGCWYNCQTCGASEFVATGSIIDDLGCKK